jgi:hypothetical protein
VSALAHVFEQAGLATVGISLVREHAARARAPRMLHCDFPLGRPLGRPHDPTFQHRVLAAAFALLPRTDVPVLVDFGDALRDEADTPLSCTLPPLDDPNGHPAVAEFSGLRPAWARRNAATGTTGVVRFGGPDGLVRLLQVLVAIADGAGWETFGLTPGDLAAAAVDLRTYYEEVALELAGHTPAARQTESWFYRQTATGLVLRRAQSALKSSGAPREAWFSLVPTGQPPAP